MRFFIFISIFVLPFITCIASKSPVCPRAKDDLSSESSADRTFQTASKVKWSKRSVKHRRMHTISNHVFQSQDSIRKAIELAVEPFRHGPGFSISRTAYEERPAILKTYVGTAALDENIIHNECKKWQRIGGLYGITTDSIPNPYANTLDRRFHIVLKNFVPRMAQSAITAAISNVLRERIRAMSADHADHFLQRALANPQEFAWLKLDHDTWIATQIHFFTKDGIDNVIEYAQIYKPIAEGSGFLIYRARHNGIKVTLKTYHTITNKAALYAECAQWTGIGGLVDTAVDLDYTVNQYKGFYMILRNSVPDSISKEDIHAAIAKAVGKRAQVRDFSNPHEFTWRMEGVIWTATPIHFPKLTGAGPM